MDLQYELSICFYIFVSYIDLRQGKRLRRVERDGKAVSAPLWREPGYCYG